MQIMAYSKASILFFIVFPACFHLCFADDGAATPSLDQLLPSLGQASLQNAQCVQKLVPCQPFLKNPVNPTEACCAPLSDMANNGSSCICTLLNNPKLFSSSEVTKDEIMKLPDACGITVDASKCKPDENSEAVGAFLEYASEHRTDESSSTTYGITYLGVATLTALVFSAYWA